MISEGREHHPVAWILARSSAPQDDTDYLFGLLEKDGATRISLGPFGKDTVAALLADAFGAPPDENLMTLAAGAAGNPSLLAELIGGLRDDDAVRLAGGLAVLGSSQLPQRLHRAARQRLDGLSKRARHLLVTASLLGPSFRLEDAAEMLGERPAVLLPAVEEAMDAGIMAATEDVFSFRHQLLHRAVADLVPPPGRKALHQQYGQILLRRGEPAALAAGHLLQAAHPDDPASLASLESAAAQTVHAAPQTAADLALRALELTAPGDPALLARAVSAAEALAAAGRLDRAARIAQDALAKPLPPVAEARLRCALSSVLCSRGQARDAAAEARMALAWPELPDGLRDHATALHLQALTGLRDELAGAAAGAVLADPAQHDRQVVAAALVARAVISWDQGQVGDGLDLLRDAARHSPGVSPDARQVQPLLALAAALVDLRQLDEAADILEAADTPALDGIPAQAALFILRARIHLANGRLTEAAAAGQHALATAGALGAHGHAATAHCVLGVIALRHGDLATAATHIARGVAPGPHCAGRYARGDLLGPGAAQRGARRPGRRADACAPGLRRSGGAPGTAARRSRHRGLAGAHRAGRGRDRTGHRRRPLRGGARLRQSGVPGDHGRRGACSRPCQPGSRPAGGGRRAASRPVGPGLRGRGPRRLHLRHAAGEQAIAQLTQAVQGYQRAGATADAARGRRRLRKLGVRHRSWTQPARRPVTGWESLTEAERIASELVAQGLNNQQVANRMYVSVHTVAFYLRQVFRKLSIRSRVELTRIVVQQGPAADEH
jgi:DNA-binding CsgD family transcriptional regulator